MQPTVSHPSEGLASLRAWFSHYGYRGHESGRGGELKQVAEQDPEERTHIIYHLTSQSLESVTLFYSRPRTQQPGISNPEPSTLNLSRSVSSLSLSLSLAPGHGTSSFSLSRSSSAGSKGRVRPPGRQGPPGHCGAFGGVSVHAPVPQEGETQRTRQSPPFR